MNEQNNVDIKNVIFEKHALMRSRDRREIADEEYKEKLNDVEKRISEMTKDRVEESKRIFEEKKKIQPEVVSTMTENGNGNGKENKIGRRVRKDSYSTYIGEALSMKSIKSFDAAADRVLNQKPGRDRKKLITHIKTIIRDVKHCKGRWGQYEWDAEAFLLTPKKPKE